MRVVLALLTLLATACGGPKFGVLPGGQLGGAVVSGPVDDWGFTDAVSRVQLETRPDDPYSVHVYGGSFRGSTAATPTTGASGGRNRIGCSTLNHGDVLPLGADRLRFV